jgi:hypothetical protein
MSMASAEEQVRILEMLQEGQITVDEASALLDAIEPAVDEPSPGRSEHRTQTRHQTTSIINDGHPLDFGAMAGHLAGAVAAVTSAGLGRRRTVRVQVDDDTPGRGGRLTFDQLVQASAVGIDPAYIRELRKLVPSLTFDQVVHAGAVGIQAEYIKAMRDAFPDLSFEQILHAGAVGVSPEYVQAMRDEVDLGEPSEVDGDDHAAVDVEVEEEPVREAEEDVTEGE